MRGDERDKRRGMRGNTGRFRRVKGGSRKLGGCPGQGRLREKVRIQMRKGRERREIDLPIYHTLSTVLPLTLPLIVRSSLSYCQGLSVCVCIIVIVRQCVQSWPSQCFALESRRELLPWFLKGNLLIIYSLYSLYIIILLLINIHTYNVINNNTITLILIYNNIIT